mmetsp:Transcript_14552/g.39971  ORF Transcript_14552/g.39971 Transcript_14552/m.39971 type:complete len:210 (+) Transcript_14552:1084-1713(+)
MVSSSSDSSSSSSSSSVSSSVSSSSSSSSSSPFLATSFSPPTGSAASTLTPSVFSPWHAATHCMTSSCEAATISEGCSAGITDMKSGPDAKTCPTCRDGTGFGRFPATGSAEPSVTCAIRGVDGSTGPEGSELGSAAPERFVASCCGHSVKHTIAGSFPDSPHALFELPSFACVERGTSTSKLSAAGIDSLLTGSEPEKEVGPSADASA